MSYPKLVSRGYGLGDILCQNEAEEAEVAAEAKANYKKSARPHGVAPGEMTDEDDGETVESLRAKLDAAGITYHPNAGMKKLRALLAGE